MHWLLNARNTEANGHKQLNENLIKMGISHSFCNVIPFSTDLTQSNIDISTITDTIFPFGSFTTAKLLAAAGRDKAIFMSDRISFDSLLVHWGDELLNSDAVVQQIGTATPIADEFFIRPNEDTKSFPAELTTKADFLEYQAKVKAGDFIWLTPDTKIVMATPKAIQAEYRLFIADGKVIGASMYRIGGESRLSANVDEYIIDYAEHVAAIWSPERLYTLDVAISNNQPKVLEVNGIHASGLYATDTQRFIEGIENMQL